MTDDDGNGSNGKADRTEPERVLEEGTPPMVDALEMDNPFWRFSLSVYGADAVRTICLDTQDRHGADVNLVLLCCWLGFAGVRLDGTALKRLDRLVDGWRQEVIGPIRAVRRRLADAIGPMGPALTRDFREEIKGAELQAEQIQQAVLFRALETLPGRDARNAERSGVARMNLTVYLKEVLAIGDKTTLRDVVEATVIACRDALEGDEDEAER